ncbi:MAG: diguanylate cyclase [Actinomycetota bacterium]|nr:diguanylate cyclase [Actinomycetota bacterium]
MSFRARLTLFFVLIVLVPMASVAFLMFGLLSKVETAEVDAAVAEQRQTVYNLYSQAIADAENAITSGVGSDLQLSEAMREGDCQAARERLQELVDHEHIARVGLVDQSGEQVCANGAHDALAPATIELEGGGSVAKLQVSVTRAAGFARRVRRLVGAPPTPRTQLLGPGLAVCIDNRLRYTSVEGVGDCPPPERATIEGPQGEPLLVRAFDATDGFGSERMVVATVTGPDDLPEGVRPGDSDTDRLVVVGILLGFFILALVFALAVSRRLQEQVAGLLVAVRRLGGGDFSTRAPTEGGDEFGELGEEFNKMSFQLGAQLDEVRRERERVLAAVRRLGAAMGSSLDRDRLLEIVMTAALEATRAHGGRVTIRPTGDAPNEYAARAGGLRGLEVVLRNAEQRALGSGDFAEATSGALSALAHPLMKREGDERHVHGVISVARADDPFSDPDRELFCYLAEQAALALENLDRYERFSSESVTDELTGLSNYRRFHDAVGLEAERWRRTGERVGLVMFDIDDFKAVNDTRGWLQGDEVLREVARVLHESSRRYDEPARYGGEELAIVLAGASLDEAHVIAERVRTQIEGLEVAAVDDKGPVRVTVSAGVSSLPECARDEHDLVATAFAALQKAKRGGKNLTACAPRIG